MNWSRENRKIKTGSILTSRIPPVCQQSEQPVGILAVFILSMQVDQDKLFGIVETRYFDCIGESRANDPFPF